MSDAAKGSSHTVLCDRVWYIDGSSPHETLQRGPVLDSRCNGHNEPHTGVDQNACAGLPGKMISFGELGRSSIGQPHMLFVGGKHTAAQIGELWLELLGRTAPPGKPGLILTTTQKQALRLLRSIAPLFVMVETQAKPNSRARFGQILRARLVETKLVAVGALPGCPDFEFDDFWAAPFTADDFAALVARMQVGNDPHIVQSHIVQHGPLRLDILTRTVVTPKGQHRMTPKQCALLHYLLDNHDRVVSRQDIMQTIWETTYMEDTRTLDVHIHWLRQCIEPEPSDPVYLRTVRGIGYHLCLAEKAQV